MSERRFLLETRGHYRVISAIGPEQALQLFGNGLGFDLVVAELLMSPIDGNEMIRQMKGRNLRVRALMTSATIKAFKGFNYADSFLSKGSPAELLERVRILARRKPGPRPIVPAVEDVVLAAHEVLSVDELYVDGESIVEDLETTKCRTCGLEKMSGLFTPAELLKKGPECRLCCAKRNKKRYGERFSWRPAAQTQEQSEAQL